MTLRTVLAHAFARTVAWPGIPWTQSSIQADSKGPVSYRASSATAGLSRQRRRLKEPLSRPQLSKMDQSGIQLLKDRWQPC